MQVGLDLAHYYHACGMAARAPVPPRLGGLPAEARRSPTYAAPVC